MSQSFILNHSLSPIKQIREHLPVIYLKTTNSPQKGQVKQPEPQIFSFLDTKVPNRSNWKRKDIQLEHAYTIRKYLQAGILAQSETNKTNSTIKNSVTEETLEQSYSQTPIRKLFKIQETLNIIKLLEGCKSNSDEEPKIQTQMDVKNECILELDQEQEEQEVRPLEKKEDLLLVSPIQQNYLGQQKKCAPSPKKKNVVLQVNQQNKEYKKYASQMIRMIRKAQQSILSDLDAKRQEEERNYKLKKIERQRERTEALQSAQEGLKKRQLKTMLLGLKGTNKQKSPLLLNLNKQFISQVSQSTICSRKTSISKLCIQPIIDKQFDDKNLIRKTSMKSEMCSLETSWDMPISIQKLI